MKGNLSFLQKELLAKNEFIKSLLETQSAILNALSNSTSKLVSLSSSLDCCFGEEDLKNKADKGKHKISQSQQKQEKNASKLYIGNLNLSIKVIDLVKLFGLNTTKCFRESCSLNVPMNDKTGQSKGNAFVPAPKHVCDELLKLNEVKFYGSQIKIEEAKSARVQTIDVSSPAKNQAVVMNKNIEKQNSLQNLSLVPDKRNYCEATLPRPSLQNTLMFTDSIPKGIRMYEFNSLLRNGKAQMLNFLGSSSKQMSHCIDIHLEDKSIGTVILHVGLNDLLNGISQFNVDDLMSSIHKIIEKCKRVGVRNIFVSGLLYTTRVSLPILERVHNLISNYCRENAFFILITEISEGFVYIKMVFIY